MNTKSLPITCATCRRRPTCLIATWRSCWPPATPWPCKRRRKVRYAYRRINTEEGSHRTIIWRIGWIHAFSNHPGAIHPILQIGPLQKTARAARNWLNSAPPPQTEATTFAFSSVFILLLCCSCYEFYMYSPVLNKVIEGKATCRRCLLVLLPSWALRNSYKDCWVINLGILSFIYLFYL